MAVIQDAELEAGFQVMVRWYVSASQRYPADENEFYSTFFQSLEPNEEFELSDPNFDLAAVNDIEDDLEYIIRDICYVQTLTPQFVSFHYYFPGYVRRAALTADADVGATTLTVDDASALSAGVEIQIGPEQRDVYTIDTVTINAGSGDLITLTTALTRSFLSGTDINESTSGAEPNYPDNTAANGLARVIDNSGEFLGDPLEVNTPLYFDTGETVLRYYYTNDLEVPFNGARGFGETQDRAPITHNGNQVVGRWWALGDFDETAADRACLIDNQGFVIDCREREHAFDLELSFANSESGACTATTTTTFYGDHPNFRRQTSPDAGTDSIITVTGQSPAEGYYAWTSTISGDNGQRFVKFWDGTEFLEGIVSSTTVDNCPIALT